MVDIIKVLEGAGAVHQDGHFVYTSGKHGPAYVNKDKLTVDPRVLASIGHGFATSFANQMGISAVVAPATAGIPFGHAAATALAELCPVDEVCPIVFAYAEKDGDAFVLKRGFDTALRGRRIVVIDDILTSGKSTRAVIDALRTADLNVVAVGVVLNRGGVTAQDLDVERLHSLATLHLEAFPAEECPLCRDGVAINTNLGHGAVFLASRQG